MRKAQLATVGDIRKLTKNLPDTAKVVVVFDANTGDRAEGFIIQAAVDTEYHSAQGEDILMVEMDAPISWFAHKSQV